jgi:hypothetical protein
MPGDTTRSQCATTTDEKHETLECVAPRWVAERSDAGRRLESLFRRLAFLNPFPEFNRELTEDALASGPVITQSDPPSRQVP